MKSDRYVKIPASKLKIGMYVVELDRPWLETPFLVQGFIVKSLEELEVLMELCNFVYIDTGRSRPFHQISRPAPAHKKSLSREKLSKILKTQTATYSDATQLQEEINSAKKVYQDYDNMVRRLFDEISIAKGSTENLQIDLELLQDPVNNIVDSIIRNPDACMLLSRLKRKGDYTYNHAIGCSIWAAALGRQLGLPKSILTSLSVGALLLDIGKLRIPDNILNKISPLTMGEMDEVRKHIQHGLTLLQKTKGVDKIAFTMIMTHHERHNGKGYPKGLSGQDIPAYGRIAAIVDTYDALINDKPHRIGIPPSEAIRTLYSVRGIDFQSELVEEFIQVIGVYPCGSIVELTTGEVGVVIGEHRRRRLRPKLLMLLDAHKQPLPEQYHLNLLEITTDAEGNPLEISRGLKSGDYGITLEENMF